MGDLDWPIIGIDESGKGDFFGPLVIGGVLVTIEAVADLTSLEVRDSKKIADKKVLALAERIKKRCPHSLVVINPEKYNQLYQKIRNLNKLLGWGHARVLENILEKDQAAAAISDKFGDDRFIRDSLQARGRNIDLKQVVRGEAHIAVAAASILARAEFLSRMQLLEKAYGRSFPRGASSLVDSAGAELVGERGEEVLTRVAKLHFKNTQKILHQVTR